MFLLLGEMMFMNAKLASLTSRQTQ